MDKIKQINLSKGAKLLHIQDSKLPYDIVSVWLKAGSRFEPAGKEGMAHLFEHLLMNKTNKYPNKIARLHALESQGIYSNAFTNREFVYYYHDQLKEKTIKSLDFLLDGLKNSIIDTVSLESEKKIVLNEKLRQRNNPLKYIWDLNFQSLFKHSSLAHSILGNEKSIGSITIQDIADYRAKYYQPSNFYFVIVSPLSSAKFVKLINNALLDFKQQSLIIKKEKFIRPARLIIEKRDLDQPQISYNFRILSPSLADIICLNFINDYLTDSWISRLIVRLRLEDNLTYWVNGSNYYLHDVGYFSFIFSSEGKKLNKIFAIINEEIDSLKNSLIDRQVLEAHKISFKANFIKNNASVNNIFLHYGYPFIMGRPILSMQEFLKKIEKITPHQIQLVAKKYFNKDNLSVSIIGKVNKENIKI